MNKVGDLKLQKYNNWRLHMVHHNMTWTKFYNKRRCMKRRCYGKNTMQYKRYWWRWIEILRNSFEEFKNDMYQSYLEHVEKYWEKETTIDRIDVNWNYCKDNCRWATYQVQASNRSNGNKYTWVTFHKNKKKERMARITVNHKELWLWDFTTEELAYEARKNAEYIYNINQ